MLVLSRHNSNAAAIFAHSILGVLTKECLDLRMFSMKVRSETLVTLAPLAEAADHRCHVLDELECRLRFCLWLGNLRTVRTPICHRHESSNTRGLYLITCAHEMLQKSCPV